MASDTNKVQIVFENNMFCDALYFAYDDYIDGKITPEQEETLKQERYDNWVYMKNNLPEPVELSPEDIQAQIDSISAMVEIYQAQIPELVNLKNIRVEEIAVAEQLALEENLIDASVSIGGKNNG